MLIGLILFPLIFSLMIFILPKNLTKYATIFYSVFSLSWMGMVVKNISSWTNPFFTENYVFSSNLPSSLLLVLDGISLVPIILTQLLIALILWMLLANQKEDKSTYSLIALMHFGLNGVFLCADALGFYIFWEVTLIPIYFICAIWGEGKRMPITLKFFLYTFIGSLCMLVSFLYLYQIQPEGGNFSIANIFNVDMSATARFLVALGIFIGLAVKIPIFGFHNWQADTYTSAPFYGSMLLAGIMLKMGLYGMYRWLSPVFAGPLCCDLQWYIIILCVIGVVYGAIIAITQTDLKRILAFSSFSHVGLIAAGIMTFSHSGWQGGLLQMFVHGLNIVGLFYIVNLIEQKYGSRDLNKLGGIATQNKWLAIYGMILVLGTTALPLTNGFPGEFLLLKSIFEYQFLTALFAGTTIIWCAVYMLRLYQKVFFGEESKLVLSGDSSLSSIEHFILIIFVLGVLVLGIFPQLILGLSESTVLNYLTQK